MIKQMSLMTLSLVLMSQTGFASSLNPIQNIFTRNSEPAGPCPMAKYKVADNISYQEMSKIAQKLKLDQRYCEANAYYRRMMAESMVGEQAEKAHYELVESLFYQRDYDELFRQATRFLQENPKSQYAERVYYLAVKAVDENIDISEGEDSRWIQAALGDGIKDPTALGENGLRNPVFSFKAFLDLYPNSPYAVHVKEILDKTRSAVSGRFITEAREHAIRWDFAPAISKLKVILAQGPSNTAFAEALFEAINFTYGFAYRVKNENQIPTFKLAKWLIIEEKDVTPELRAKLAKDLEQQAHTMKKMMREKLPNDKWTKRLM